MARLTLDRGDRRTVQIPVTRTGDDPAPALQFCVVTGEWVPDDWFTVSPVDEDVNPGVYEITVAYGQETDFPTGHPAGTRVVYAPCQVLMRPPSGHDIDVQHVAWITVR